MEDRTVTALIAGMKYRLNEVDALGDEGGFTARRAVINVNKGQDPAFRYNTLWHELGHAIIEHFGQGLDLGDNEEAIVSVFAAGICQILTDNPWLRSAKRAHRHTHRGGEDYGTTEEGGD